MSEKPASDSVRRFADDLRRIREARGITTTDLHNETKIPVSLLQSFEQTGLFDHPMFNRVYLRSFVRSYSEVLGISPDVSLLALDEAFESRYNGRLGWEYLGEERPPEVAVEQPLETGSDIAGSLAIPGGLGKAAATKPVEDREAIRHIEKPEHRVVEPVDDLSWAAQSPPSGMPAYEVPQDRRGGGSKWLLLLGGVVVVGVALFFVLRGMLGGREQVEEPVAAAPDTTAIEDTTVSRPAAVTDTAAVALPDSIQLVLIAGGDGVQGMRVKPDTTTRYPIWIEKDSSRVLKFANRITLENQIPDVRARIGGKEFVLRPDTSGRVLITRDEVRKLLAASATGN